MVARLTGTIELIEESCAVLVPDGAGGIAYEVMLPAYLAQQYADKPGRHVTFITLQYMESQNQGASFIPRLIGFGSTKDRDFFELFTTVKGIGNRKALRAMAMDPAKIAAAVAARDAKALQSLPEIGKRLADTIIAELSGKVERYLSDEEYTRLEDASRGTGDTVRDPAANDAVAVLVQLGECEGDARRLVARVIDRAGRQFEDANELVGLVLAAR